MRFEFRMRRAQRLLLCGALSAAATVATVAHADDVPDTVILSNGGRVRGLVVEEDPVKGVTIKLVDGTMKKLTAKEVKEVQYAPKPAPAPVPAAPVAPPPVVMQPMGMPQGNLILTPNGYVMMAPPQMQTHRANGGLWASGLVFLILGSVGVAAGAVTFGAGEADSCKGDNGTFCVAGGVMLPIFGSFLIAGIPMTIIGGRRVPGPAMESRSKPPPWWTPVAVAPTRNGATARWEF
jgi:hypothetical protein